MVKIIIGFLLILGGIVLGLYLGLWLMFIGSGINILRHIIETINNGVEIELGLIAWNAFKMMMASIVGWLSAIILIVPGWAMIKR